MDFLSFLGKDHSFFTPWNAPVAVPLAKVKVSEDENQQLQQEVEGEKKREELNQTPFSFFSRQWDYYYNNKNMLEEKEEEEQKGP